MANKGIDYGMGQTNIDRETGIRYGIISQHSLMSEALNDFEPDYGEPHCPKCGNEAKDADDTNDIEVEDEYYCEECEFWFGGHDAFGDEPLGHEYDGDGYLANLDNDGDVWVFKSQFYTRAQFCSPCAPGACHLDHPMTEGEKCYCFGHDWFEGGKAPYPVYSVSDDSLVDPGK